jgi:hypothetical protein
MRGLRELMEAEILKFWDRHPELRLFGMVRRPQGGPVYFFKTTDGVSLDVSIDFGLWKHLRFHKTHPYPPSDGEMASYLDFFGGAKWLRNSNAPGDTIYFCEAGCPQLRQVGLDSQ